SGALLLALSQGLPVVAPAGGATSELLDDAAGFLHRDGELAQALARAAAAPLDAPRSAALRIAERCTWDRAAQGTLNAYRGVTYALEMLAAAVSDNSSLTPVSLRQRL